MKNPAPNNYNINSEFEDKKKGKTIGVGREVNNIIKYLYH